MTKGTKIEKIRIKAYKEESPLLILIKSTDVKASSHFFVVNVIVPFIPHTIPIMYFHNFLTPHTELFRYLIGKYPHTLFHELPEFSETTPGNYPHRSVPYFDDDIRNSFSRRVIPANNHNVIHTIHIPFISLRPGSIFFFLLQTDKTPYKTSPVF